MRAEDSGRGFAPGSLRLGGVKDTARAHKGQPVLGMMGTEIGPWRGGQADPRWKDKHTGIRGDLHEARLVSPPF